MKKVKGFTLIELMVVIAIIGILASIAMPSYQSYIQRSEVVEAIVMANNIQRKVTDYYRENQAFPQDNQAAGVPEPQYLLGNRITRVEVDAGAIHVTLGNKASAALQGKVLSFRPATVIDSPSSPIAWLCGYETAVAGMQAVGQNLTDLAPTMLLSGCRG